ncbi:MAG: response regulator [Stellaceae bacterium]
MPDAHGSPETGARAISPGITVLVIDDNHAHLLSLESLLEAYGIRVAKARDGAEGLALFRKIAPAVVLTDIIMPGRDGISAIVEMRRERPGVKIIAMSGAGRVGKSDFLTVAKQLGADEVMPKPLDTDRLIATLRRILRDG